MNDKIIFLDIDGVLNSDKWENQYEEETGKFAGLTYDLDPTATNILHQIVEATGADIVLSSSWRMIRHAKEAVINHLKSYGMSFIDVTPCLRTERGNEIENWLNNHPEVKHIAILDDDDDMGKYKPYLVQTTWTNGLENKHIDLTIETIKKELI